MKLVAQATVFRYADPADEVPYRFKQDLLQWSRVLFYLAQSHAETIREAIGDLGACSTLAYAQAALLYHFGHQGGFYDGEGTCPHLLISEDCPTVIVPPDPAGDQQDAYSLLQALGWSLVLHPDNVGTPPIILGMSENPRLVAAYEQTLKEYVQPAILRFANTLLFGPAQKEVRPTVTATVSDVSGTAASPEGTPLAITPFQIRHPATGAVLLELELGEMGPIFRLFDYTGVSAFEISADRRAGTLLSLQSVHGKDLVTLGDSGEGGQVTVHASAPDDELSDHQRGSLVAFMEAGGLLLERETGHRVELMCGEYGNLHTRTCRE